MQKPSLVMLDKTVTIRRKKLKYTIGQIEESQLLQINRLLAVFPGLADPSKL